MSRMATSDPDSQAIQPSRKPANRRRRTVAAGTIPPTLPPSVEEAYRKKCIELKRRMGEVEQNNDSFRLRKNRLLRGIRKMRLERSILLHELGKRMRRNGTDGYFDDSENSSEGPPTVGCHPVSTIVVIVNLDILIRYEFSQMINLSDQNVATDAQQLLHRPWHSSS